MTDAADSPGPRVQAVASTLPAPVCPPSSCRDDTGAPIQSTELDAALAGPAIETRYQPIVRLEDRRPVALEVLVRLNHPTRGTLAPDAFVPLIEDAGLAARLTDLVTARALADSVGPSLGPLGLAITLNFPLDVLLVPDALRRLDAGRQAAGLPAARVIIELTESRPVEDLPTLVSALERLHTDGYRVSIDDISPGMPLLADLLALPFDSVKLDQAVVRHQHETPELRDFVQHIVGVAGARHLSVVAEGVEDVATWQQMRALGVGLAQGFLIARPLPAAEVPAWLATWRSQPDFG